MHERTTCISCNESCPYFSIIDRSLVYTRACLLPSNKLGWFRGGKIDGSEFWVIMVTCYVIWSRSGWIDARKLFFLSKVY
ncbi:hypothetical protein Hanom_Chr08g00738901 [Helianthus anomalus]